MIEAIVTTKKNPEGILLRGSVAST